MITAAARANLAQQLGSLGSVPAKRKPLKGTGLGNFASDWFLDNVLENDSLNPVNKYFQAAEQAKVAQCVGVGNQKASALDLQQANVAANWQPTGVFTPSDIDAIVAQINQMAQTTGAELDAAPVTTADGAFNISNEKQRIIDHVVKGQVFTQAALQARAQGGTVSAPSLKLWVVQAMGACSAGVVAAAVEVCEQTWLDRVAAALSAAFAAVAAVVLAAVNAVVEVGKATVELASDAAVSTAGFLGFVFTALKALPVVVVLGLGTFTFFKVRKWRRASGGKLPTAKASKSKVDPKKHGALIPARKHYEEATDQ